MAPSETPDRAISSRTIARGKELPRPWTSRGCRPSSLPSP